MHRVTTRLLLLLLLVSVLAPAALALSTPDPDTCCRRIHRKLSTQPELSNLPECCKRGDCALPLSVFLWGGVAPQATYLIGPSLVTVQHQGNPIHRIALLNASYSVRGPPMFFLA